MRVLMIGATGMLGRPVARRLVADEFDVRVLVRDIRRAKKLLPRQCELIEGDLHDGESVKRAMQGMDAAYLNLAPPSREEAWNPDLEGSKLVAGLAMETGVKRLMRISAMGVPDGADNWWVARDKAVADRAVMESGVPYTIFRPDWFCESLALFILGRFYLLPRVPRDPLHWITGEDYARQVSAALRTDKAANRVYTVQGPEGVSLQEASQRFREAAEIRLVTLPIPRTLLRINAALSAQAKYLDKLFDLTYTWTIGFEAEAAWDELGKPTMTIEDCARSLQRTGDWPRK